MNKKLKIEDYIIKDIEEVTGQGFTETEKTSIKAKIRDNLKTYNEKIVERNLSLYIRFAAGKIKTETPEIRKLNKLVRRVMNKLK